MAGRIGEAVARERGIQRLTAVQLSARTQELGYPITRGTIARIEGNHRAGKFDVAELMVLAQALRVPPVLLLFPHLPDEDVSINPASDVPSGYQALLWFTGESNIFAFSSEASLRFLSLVRKYVDLRREFAPALIRAHNQPEDEVLHAALRDVEGRLGELADTLRAGGAAVDLGPEIRGLLGPEYDQLDQQLRGVAKDASGSDA